MSEEKLKRDKRKATHSIQSLWERNNQREISTSRLLRECAHVYGPAASGGQC
ncbi:hypothetical protein DPMN_045105 [Dreissena polymorpha]|uniref:Uncharacterized protein n=1 Tax=Dreissena polymorpha TaxID=45954 RepID=A0A9D4D5V5_DREPO|nr:hypothetical protein DPMN_045105 [Dreissena polymorpha]